MDAATSDAAAPDAADVTHDAGPIADADRAVTVTVEIEGVVTFDDRAPTPNGLGPVTPAPARGVTVDLLRAADRALVLTTRTDDAGRFALRGEVERQDHEIEVVAQTSVGLVQASVTDRARRPATYALGRSVAIPGPGALSVAMHASEESGLGGVFNIVDALYDGLLAFSVVEPRPRRPLELRWERGRPFGCGSCYGGGVISLGGGLADRDEYDDAIILHELGHYIVDAFGADDSPGGPHRGQQVSPRLAYGEGLAYFLAGMVRDDPVIVDTFIDSTWVVDMEAVTVNDVRREDLVGTADGTVNGALREEVISGTLWDAYDAENADEPFDTLELGAEASLRLLLPGMGARVRPDVGPAGLDLSDVLNALGCDHGQDEAQALADDRGFPYSVTPPSCEKGARTVPVRLEVRDDHVWAIPTGESEKSPVIGGAWRHRVIDERPTIKGEPFSCALPCPVGLAMPSEGWVLTWPLDGRAGVAWMGEGLQKRQTVGVRVGDRRVVR